MLRTKKVLNWLKDVLARAAGSFVAQLFLLGLVGALPFFVAQLDARLALKLLSPVPAYSVVVAFLAGTALVLSAYAIMQRRGLHLTNDERRLLVLLQQAGEDGAYFEGARRVIGLNLASFDLLVHGLKSRSLVEDRFLDPGFYQGGDPWNRGLSIRGKGKTLLAKLSPRLLDDAEPPEGVQVRRRERRGYGY
jgi:hypothetical protein